MNGAAIIEANVDFAIEVLESLMFFSFVIFCGGIFVFCFIEIIKLLAPKSPVNNGRSGCWMFRFSEEIPRNPANVKMIKAQSFLFGSVRIRYSEVRIKINGIILVT